MNDELQHLKNIGHRRRRAEGIPLLEDKFKANLAQLDRKSVV